MKFGLKQKHQSTTKPFVVSLSNHEQPFDRLRANGFVTNKKSGINKSAGFTLLPVVLTMTLIAAIAFLLNRDNGVNAEMVASQSDSDRARYAAEAGLQAVNASIQGNNCTGSYPSIINPKSNSNFGGAIYSAYAVVPSGNSTSLVSTGSYNGTSVTLTRSNVLAYQTTPNTYTLQPAAGAGQDTFIRFGAPTSNFGNIVDLEIKPPNGIDYSLLKFDLAAFPAGSLPLSALLYLYPSNISGSGTNSVYLYRLVNSWTEGDGSSGSGATWNTRDGTLSWSTVGGDRHPVSVAVSNATQGVWSSFDVTDLTTSWLLGRYANNGMLLDLPLLSNNMKFSSSDHSIAANRPKMTIQYLLPCGTTGPSGNSGTPQNILMVVANDKALSAQETARITLLTSWGYQVNVIDDGAAQTVFNEAITNNPVAYVSQEVGAASLGTKLLYLPIGIINENKDLIDDFGFATLLAISNTAMPSMTIDPGHYITSTLTANPIQPYVSNDWAQVTGTLGPGISSAGQWSVAPFSARPALMTLNKGAPLLNGGSAAGCRVQLPWGSGPGTTPVALSSLSADALTIIKRSIAYALECPQYILLVVADATALNAQETARKALIESWGYKVNVMDDNASQASFTAAFNNNMAVYVPETADAAALGSKLYAAPIGIVNENILHSFALDFGKTAGNVNETAINILDNSHSITSGFTLGLNAIVSSPQSFTYIMGGLAKGAQQLASTNTGSVYKDSLFTIDKGNELSTIGTFAAGRRVQLPWGYTNFDINALNTAGKDIMKRALEWAAGKGAAPTSNTVTLTPVADTYVDTKNAGNNYGTSQTLILGGDTTKGNLFNGLLAFNVLAAVPPNAKITAAQLRLYEGAKGAGGALTLEAHRLTRAWSETQATANKATASVNWSNTGGDYDPAVISSAAISNTGGIWDTWDVMPLVQEWVDGISPDYGLILIRQTGGTGNPNTKHVSREGTPNPPELVISYTVP